MITRKPINEDVVESKGKPVGRQAMWDAMRGKDIFTLVDIVATSQREESTARTYINLLIKAGIVEEAGKKKNGRYQTTNYRIVRDLGHRAPRIRADGTPIIEAREQMWRAMKMIKAFNYLELATLASTDECLVSPSDASDYCKHLLKAGYLKLEQEATNKRKAVYSLLPSMNTGPNSPKVQRTKVVFDTNLNKLMWHEVK